MHVTSISETSHSLDDFLNFRDYCNQNEDARIKYTKAKEKASKDGQMDKYYTMKIESVLKLI